MPSFRTNLALGFVSAVVARAVSGLAFDSYVDNVVTRETVKERSIVESLRNTPEARNFISLREKYTAPVGECLISFPEDLNVAAEKAMNFRYAETSLRMHENSVREGYGLSRDLVPFGSSFATAATVLLVLPYRKRKETQAESALA